jgi:hypothetical protein
MLLGQPNGRPLSSSPEAALPTDGGLAGTGAAGTPQVRERRSATPARGSNPKTRLRQEPRGCPSGDVDEVRRVQWVLRKREGKGRFRRDLAFEQGHLVHILPEGRNAQDTPTDARRSAEAPSAESAPRRREKFPPGNNGEETGVINKHSPSADVGAKSEDQCVLAAAPTSVRRLPAIPPG